MFPNINKVKLRETHCAVTAQKPNHCKIEDKDFKTEFDGEKWTVEWYWKGKPPVLENKVECYRTPLEDRERKRGIWESGGKEDCGGHSSTMERWSERSVTFDSSGPSDKRKGQTSIGLLWAEQTCREPYWRQNNWHVWWKDEKMDTVGGRNCNRGP